MSQVGTNTPGESQGVLQSLASGIHGEVAAMSLSNPSFCLLDHPGILHWARVAMGAGRI